MDTEIRTAKDIRAANGIRTAEDIQVTKDARRTANAVSIEVQEMIESAGHCRIGWSTDGDRFAMIYMHEMFLDGFTPQDMDHHVKQLGELAALYADATAKDINGGSVEDREILASNRREMSAKLLRWLADDSPIASVRYWRGSDVIVPVDAKV